MAETGPGRPHPECGTDDPGAAPAEALAPPCSLYDLYCFFDDFTFIPPERPENGGDTIQFSRIKSLLCPAGKQ